VSKAAKVGRRLSARVGDMFRTKAKGEVVTPAKVAEDPPKIDSPVTHGPLADPSENPAPAGPNPGETPTETAPPAPAAAPTVAAAA
jgi:hypothetical protein